MAITNSYNENLKEQNSAGTLAGNHIEQPVKHALVNNNQDLHYLYQQAPIGIILSIVSALLVCWFVLPTTPDYLYIPWLTFIGLTCLIHSFLIKEFDKHKQSLHVNNQWAIYHTFMIGTTALAFSVGYLLFLPLASTFTQIVLLLILAIMAVSFLPVLSVFLPAYIIYISAFIFPIIFWIYSLPAEKAYPIAALLTVTYCVLVIAASYYSKVILEAFGLATEVKGEVNTLCDVIDETKTLNLKLKKDIYDYTKKNDSIYKQKKQAEITLQSIGEGVISTDEFGRINYINPIAEIYTGWNAKDVEGKDFISVVNLVDESSYMHLPDPVIQCLKNNTTVNSTDNSLLIRNDGLEYAIEYSITPINHSKNLVGSVMVFRDVTEKRNMERNLNWQAKHDSLTGLINRREFDNRLKKILGSLDTSKHEHALCYIDLDRFKLVNDSCGHQAGDELLQKIINRLKRLTRETDTLARLGGDEFAVIMYSCTLEKAKLIAEIFREEISKTNFEWHGKNFTVSASIGIVPLNNATKNLTELQRIADIACYRAKDNGGNCIDIYNPDKSEQVKHTGELKLLEDLQHNLEKESFKLFTQKIKPLDDFNDVIFHEVLLRMKKVNGDMLSANNFLHTAEAYHMLPEIDNWVLKVVMEMIAYGNPLFNASHMISINLSQQSVLNEPFITYASNMFHDYDIPAGHICFEINEPKFYGSADKFKHFVNLIKRQGCRVALDDFNYTPANINTVRELAIDYIKLDARQFCNLHNEHDFNYKLLKSINDINHLTGAQTIIKCIDNINVIEFLYEIGTDYVQGYAIDPPKMLDNSNKLIASN